MMFCPKCNQNQPDHFRKCPACQTALVASSRQESQISEDPLELVTVFNSQDKILLSIARSVLEANKIDFFVRGEGIQNLFGAGAIGVGFNLVTGPIEIQVAQKDTEEALKLLKEVE